MRVGFYIALQALKVESNCAFMEICLTSLTSLLLLLLATRQYINNRRIVQPDEEKARYIVYIDVVLVFDILSNQFGETSSFAGMPFAILLSLTSVFLLSTSVFEFKQVRIYVQTVIMVQFLIGLWHLLSSLCLVPQLPDDFCMPASCVSVCLLVFYFIYGLYVRMKNIKFVMKSGYVWKNVTLTVDTVYLSLILLITMLYALVIPYSGSSEPVSASVFTFMYMSMYVALGVRMLNASAFVFMTEHERKIVESMKISHVDSRAESPGTAMLYKNIYDRLQEYFAENKPYLNNNLTINDVVEVIFSNKLYISRAISQFTGRNFCQYVNYYRVVHAVELFRNDTSLKVTELASLSGFNSSVSFGMAFRLYMGEKPGDWCRKEKYRQEKLKK